MPVNPTPSRQRVFTFLTPRIQDFLFYETKEGFRHEPPAYGTPHPDKKRWPNHKLCYVEQAEESGALDKWYYAAERESQDEYNAVLNGDELIRTYVIPRNKYFARPVGHPDAVEGEFLYPPAGAASPDSVFTAYCFADDTLIETNQELSSLFVVIKRRFVEPVATEYLYNESLMRNVRVTKTVIPAGSFVPTTPTAGSTSEVKSGNYFHDIQIDQEIALGEGESYPYSLPTLPATYNRSFPAKLESINLVWAWAWAGQLTEPSAPESYSEDYYFKTVVTEARPGPYSATIYRYITDDPDAIKAANPITIVPQPVRESIAVVGAWYYASPDGNATAATAKEHNLPPTIHPEVTVNIGGKATPKSDFYVTESIDATPGYSTFAGVTTCTVDFDVKQAPLGLFEVSVVKIDISNLYSNAYGGGGGGVTIVEAPTNVTATAISATQVNVSWDLVPGATKYLVYRSTNGVSYSYIAEIADPQDIHMDYGRTTGTTYYYRVRAAYLGFESGYSNTASATTP